MTLTEGLDLLMDDFGLYGGSPELRGHRRTLPTNEGDYPAAWREGMGERRGGGGRGNGRGGGGEGW